ncbi:cache domain-containing sensor histidine kinase [Paenibacillus sp. UNC451MF]|uniref:cache domain-containing sensor histidine kinase n=1 Tax=Paenibacillus sp. UNC451MF TaxID=1449063 RepID=UPI00056D7D07|nr:histidine kinase [Paenibacillus sp. UNC451MF]
MSNIFHFTFYRRIQISFLLLILLPTVAVSYISYSVTQNNVKEKIRLSNESVIAVMAKDITKMIDDLTYSSNFFVQDTNVRKELRSFADTKRIGNYSDLTTYQQIKDFFSLTVAKTMNTDILMFLVNNEGFIVQSSESLSVSPEQIQQHWEKVKDRVDPDQRNLLQWLGTVAVTSNGEQSNYYVSRVLRDPADNRLLGILYIAIPSQYFDKLFQQLQSGNMVLYDANGVRIAGDSNVAYSAAEAPLENVRNEVMIEKAGWKLVYETPKKEVTGEISRTFYIALFLVVPFFIIFFLISIVMAKRLHRPIRQLELGVKLFGEGNRKIRFQAEGKDEIADLGKTLNTMLDQINQLIIDIEQEQEQKREMELQALFSQIRPHFLLNTLNSIKCNLVLHNDELHSSKIDSLMSLLRAYMKFSEPSTLQSECKLLASYVDIMQMRNDIQLEFEVHLEKDTEGIDIPKLLLQPIVENAFVHGFAEEVDRPRIEIRSKLTDGELQIRIEDNGAGSEEQRLKEMNEWLQHPDAETHSSYKRVGLMNVLQRLQMTYGPGASMHLTRNEAGGVAVLLRIPLKPEEAEHSKEGDANA